MTHKKLAVIVINETMSDEELCELAASTGRVVVSYAEPEPEGDDS